MSTTTATGTFTAKAQSGSNQVTWGHHPGDPGLTFGLESGEAIDSSVDAEKYTKTAKFSIPSWAASIPANAEFVSLRVTLSVDYDNTPNGYAEAYASLSDGSVTFTKSLTASPSTWTLDGDKTYWGLTESDLSIVDRILSGSNKFELQCYNSAGSGGFLYLNYASLDVRMTYTVADTHVTASLIPIP